MFLDFMDKRSLCSVGSAIIYRAAYSSLAAMIARVSTERDMLSVVCMGISSLRRILAETLVLVG